MKIKFKSACKLIVIASALAPSAVAFSQATVTRPSEGLLLPGEEFVFYQNCAKIATPEEAEYDRDISDKRGIQGGSMSMLWDGTCIDGLVHGKGLLTTTWKETDLKLSDVKEKIEFYYGYNLVAKVVHPFINDITFINDINFNLIGIDNRETALTYRDGISIENINVSEDKRYFVSYQDKPTLKSPTSAYIEGQLFYVYCTDSFKKVAQPKASKACKIASEGKILGASLVSVSLNGKVSSRYESRRNEYCNLTESERCIAAVKDFLAPKMAEIIAFQAKGLAANRAKIAKIDNARLAISKSREIANEQRLAAANESRLANEMVAIRAKERSIVRISSFVKIPGNAAPGVEKEFSSPAETESIAVIILGENVQSLTNLYVDQELIGLNGYRLVNIAYPKAADVNNAVNSMAAAGMKTVYIVDVRRANDTGWTTAMTEKRSRIKARTEVRDNPEYPRLQGELRRARSEMQVAKAAYDEVNNRANNGSYSSNAGAAISGAFEIASVSGRYSKAQNRVFELENALDKMSPQIKSETVIDAVLADVSYTSLFRGQLAIIACDITAKRCGEKERTVAKSYSGNRPLILMQGDPDYVVRQQAEQAYHDGVAKEYGTSQQFGVSVADLGTYMDGAKMPFALDKIGAYAETAQQDFSDWVKGENSKFDSSERQYLKRISEIGGALSAYSFEDSSGMVDYARSELAKDEKRRSLQSLTE